MLLDPALAIRVDLGQLGQLVQAVVLGGRADGRLKEWAGPLVDEARDRLDLDPRVEHLERRHLGEGGHPLAVTVDGGVDRVRVRRGVEPKLSPGTIRLAASRLRSHSHGPGSVSSKSLMSNRRSRSGEANRPKFDRWASPQAWTVRPLTGVCARSTAIGSAAPRKNVNGETAILP